MRIEMRLIRNFASWGVGGDKLTCQTVERATRYSQTKYDTNVIIPVPPLTHRDN